jgi:hypothetical protein
VLSLPNITVGELAENPENDGIADGVRLEMVPFKDGDKSGFGPKSRVVPLEKFCKPNCEANNRLNTGTTEILTVI